MSIPVSLQLYTLRDECSQDFAKTLQQVALLGYQGVEFAGYWGMDLPELRKLIDQLGLRASGSHVSFQQLEQELDQAIEAQQILGSSHLIVPSMPQDRREIAEEYYRLAEQLNDMGRKCSESGITLSYHNHNFELASFNNRKGLEIILDETNPQWVKAELDVYWLKKAGEDPAQWMQRYAGRTPLIHLKDMTADEEQFFAELGTGVIDLHSIVAQGEASNVQWWVVEQDRSRRNPLESVGISIEYFRKNLSVYTAK